MGSTALLNFANRMKDIDRLLVAHQSAVKFIPLQQAIGSGRQSASEFMRALTEAVSPPSPGRPPELSAINRAAIVLLSAHVEGFVEDLYRVAATSLLNGKMLDLQSLIKNAQDRFRNPNTEAVEVLFITIGITGVLDGIRWRKSSNQQTRKRLDDFVRLRNRIAHGGQEPVKKAAVTYWKNFAERLARGLDAKVGREIAKITHTSPW